MCRSPWLIAAYHGLRRLCVPRHPPHAFSRLTPIQSVAALESLPTVEPPPPIEAPNHHLLIRTTRNAGPIALRRSDQRLTISHFGHAFIAAHRVLSIFVACSLSRIAPAQRPAVPENSATTHSSPPSIVKQRRTQTATLGPPLGALPIYRRSNLGKSRCVRRGD